MNDTNQPISPRRRMQELLAIPDSIRSDAEWDELNELEIQLAAVNREGAPPPRTHASPKRRPGPGPGPGQAPRPQKPAASAPGAGGNKPTGRKFHKRPPKPARAAGEGGGGNGGGAGGSGGGAAGGGSSDA